MKNLNNIYVLIPVYNEEKIIEETINNLKVYFDNILIINDGSTDKTHAILENLDVIKINHPINLGQGAAIKTGIEYILKFTSADAVVTFDADGQHSVDDAISFAKKIDTIEEEIIFGSRFLGFEKNIPFFKRLLLKTAIYFTNVIYSIKMTDTHNGLKAIKRSCLEKLELNISGYGFETEIIMNISKKKILFIEEPTNVIYTEYSLSKGQSIFNAIKIFEELLLRLFKK